MSGKSKTQPVSDLLAAIDASEAQVERIKARQREDKNRRTIADLKAEVKLLKFECDLERDRSAVLEELRSSKPPKLKAMKARKRQKAGKLPASFVALASDWHTCEVVTKKRTGGINEHNVEIGHERAWEWAKGVVTMLEREMQTCDIETFVLWLGGDFLVNDGMHYKSERATLQSPTQEARIMRDLLGQIIQFFRNTLDVPRIVIPTSFGNHDRTTMKMVPGHGADYSHAQEVYYDLRDWFAISDPSIEFRIAEADYDVVDVHGFKILFHHGHEVNYGGGHSGLAIPISKTVAALQKDYAFDTLCIGHFHTRGIYPRALTNGSLVGPNGYSRTKKFASEPPAQVAFVVDHSRQAIANYYAIWGD